MDDKLLYNVTVKISIDVHSDWYEWMKSKHIPDVLATGMFESHKMSQILGTEEDNGLTYAIQYVCKNIMEFDKYQKEHAPKLRDEHTNKFKDKFVAFRTLMRIVDES